MSLLEMFGHSVDDSRSKTWIPGLLNLEWNPNFLKSDLTPNTQSLSLKNFRSNRLSPKI